MNTQAKIIVGVLVAVVAGLGITVGVMATSDDGRNDSMSSPMDGDDAYTGMMGAMGDTDSDAMLSHMREILGADGFQRMMDHLSDHRNGGPMTGDPNVDQMMHSMMDGMMQHMPVDGDNVMPPGRDEHHVTPAATGTPTN